MIPCDLVICTTVKHTYYISIYLPKKNSFSLPVVIFENKEFVNEEFEQLCKHRIPEYLHSQLFTVTLCRKNNP